MYNYLYLIGLDLRVCIIKRKKNVKKIKIKIIKKNYILMFDFIFDFIIKNM